MLIFVWTGIYDGLTENYHSGGGAIVVAENLDAAHAALIAAGVKEDSDIFETEPEIVTAVPYLRQPQVLLQRDTGCC